MKILVVDDERAVRESLRRALELEGYEIELAADGNEALDRLESESEPDAVILDVLMPDVDGLEVCRRLRSAGDRTPVLMLTARDAIDDRVAGLDAGADDYLVKPFALDELNARVRALLRRAAPENGEDERLSYLDLELDVASARARRGDRTLELTRTEQRLLELLLRNPDQVLPRDMIYERVWGHDISATSNSLDVYVGYLRRKTEEGGESRLIHTVRGVGFRLTD
jgi:two-component system, OmpR family, response regulator MprA